MIFVTAAQKLPKPRLRVSTDARSWTIDYTGGALARFRRCPNDPGCYPPTIVSWNLTYDGAVVASSWSPTPDLAAAVVRCRVAADRFRPDPVEQAHDFEVRRLAEDAERAPKRDAAKIFRELLRRRTGMSWSVRCSRASARIYICAPPKRCNGDVMTSHDVALLAAVIGTGELVPNRGITIGQERGDRAAAVYRIAGVKRPGEVEVAEVRHG